MIQTVAHSRVVRPTSNKIIQLLIVPLLAWLGFVEYKTEYIIYAGMYNATDTQCQCGLYCHCDGGTLSSILRDKEKGIL